MTLCGVLRNIILVGASILIWSTLVSGVQFAGYGIALLGLIYYGVGIEGVLEYYSGLKGFLKSTWRGGSEYALVPESAAGWDRCKIGNEVRCSFLSAPGLGTV